MKDELTQTVDYTGDGGDIDINQISGTCDWNSSHVFHQIQSLSGCEFG